MDLQMLIACNCIVIFYFTKEDNFDKGESGFGGKYFFHVDIERIGIYFIIPSCAIYVENFGAG